VVGAAYRREILEPNGTRDGMELLRAFLGRDPSPSTFLRLLGIEEAAPARGAVAGAALTAP